ncbi:MAG: class I SAM-dependent methyltransferase [Oscillospiraceae bacterium]|jgi:ubiquinone/menaquinone biosynthesis C-methylase UbiE|nr:class I SAM-dependent methyltransferase [Oscillospiraceae bacterium]
MNTYWSQYVQTSEELYRSRALRFHDGNKDMWLGALGVKDDTDILEVGCGGGIFCHRLKQYLPGARVTGLDFDTGHIDYARQKSAALGLDCAFVPGDALALPFPDNSFDLCYSYTVMNFCEPNAFLAEQRRVLRPGGRIAVLNVNAGINSEHWKPDETSPEKELFDRLWAEADKNELSQVKKISLQPRDYPVYLEKAGLRDIHMEVISYAHYNPDSSGVSEETALEQINANRLSELCSVQKARAMAPAALTDAEYAHLVALINERFDERIRKYKAGEKLWDFSACLVLCTSGVKA